MRTTRSATTKDGRVALCWPATVEPRRTTARTVAAARRAIAERAAGRWNEANTSRWPTRPSTRRTRADDADSPVDDIDGRPGHWRVRKRFLPAGDEVRLPCVNAGGVPAAAVGECATPRYDENVDTTSQSAVPHMLTASTSRDCARACCPVPLT